MEKIYNEMLKKLKKEQIFLNEPMSKHTTFKIGGPADFLVKVNTLEELKYIINISKKYNLPVTIIGNGSNVLVKDGGIRGITIKLNLKNIEVIDKTKIKAGAGVLLHKLSKEALKNQLSGLEFAVGIPGTLGGAIRMNAGAYGSDMKSIIESVTYLDEKLETHTINNEQNEFKYRTSRFEKNKSDIIISAVLNLKSETDENIKIKMEKNIDSRNKKQPVNLPSAGSSFKRKERIHNSRAYRQM